jgi:hypothetical protein
MRRFVEGVDRGQNTLFPGRLDDWVDENNPVRAIDACRSACKKDPVYRVIGIETGPR